MRFNFFGRQIYFDVKSRPTLFTNGITNITEDRKFVLFADYDNTNLEVVENDAYFLQENYDIGDLLILRSSDEKQNAFGDHYANYHLIGFTKLQFPEVLRILETLRCDPHFKKGWKYQQRCWVLRLGYKKELKTKQITKGKPVLESFINADSERVYSSAHVGFFSKLYGIKIKQKNIDALRAVKLIDYVTR